MQDFPDPAPGSKRRWAIFVIGSLNFLISMFYRVSPAMISPTLVRDLDLTSSQLSDLSASFYYAFALSQVPLGIAIDRIGPRFSMGFLSLAAVGGAVCFAMGRTPEHLIAARALLGIGMSGNMMVLLALLAVWFPVNRFAFLSGAAIAVGSLGNLLAATPLALLIQAIGWRGSFLLFAGINAAIVFTFLMVAKDGPEGRTSGGTQGQSFFGGLSQLAKMYSYWAISLSNFVRYGYFAALQSLWLGPFLVFGMGMGELDAGNCLLCLGIGYLIGLPLWGLVSDKVLRSRQKVVLPTMIAFCVITLSFVLWTRSVPTWMIALTFFCFGFTAAPGQILYAHMKELLPPTMIARALTSVNFFTILGVGAMIHIMGFFMTDEPSAVAGPASFHYLWYVGVVGLTLVCVLYSLVPDSPALRRGEPQNT